MMVCYYADFFRIQEVTQTGQWSVCVRPVVNSWSVHILTRTSDDLHSRWIDILVTNWGLLNGKIQEVKIEKQTVKFPSSHLWFDLKVALSVSDYLCFLLWTQFHGIKDRKIDSGMVDGWIGE